MQDGWDQLEFKCRIAKGRRITIPKIFFQVDPGDEVIVILKNPRVKDVESSKGDTV